MIFPPIPDAALSPAQRRIRRANLIDAATHKPTGAGTTPEHPVSSVESAASSAPVRTFTGTDESGLQWLVRDYGDVMHVATRRDDWATWSAPVVLAGEPVSTLLAACADDGQGDYRARAARQEGAGA